MRGRVSTVEKEGRETREVGGSDEGNGVEE